MAHKGPEHLEIPVQCTEAAPEEEAITVIPMFPKENRTDLNFELKQVQAEVDATKLLVVFESNQRLAHVDQVAKQLASLETESEKVATKICQCVCDLKQQVHSIEYSQDRMQQQLSLLQKTEQSTQSDLMKLRGRLDEIHNNSVGIPLEKEAPIPPYEVRASCDQMPHTAFVKHLTIIKSEAEGVKSRLENRIGVLERKLESVERNFKVEEIYQRLQQLQSESQRIENDVHTIKEDVKKELEGIKQQIMHTWPLISEDPSDFESGGVTSGEDYHIAYLARSDKEVVVRRRKKPVTNMDLVGMSSDDSCSTTTMLADSLPTTITSEVNRTSRASSGYESMPSSRPTSIARSESNASLCTQGLPLFSLEDFKVLKEEEGEADQKLDDEVD